MLGKRLAALLPIAIRERLRRELWAPNVRLRLRLSAGSAVDVGWEYLFLPPAEDEPANDEPVERGFPARDSGIRMVRSLPGDYATLEIPSGPVRVLVVWADPRSERYAELANAREEAADVLRTLRPAAPAVEVEELSFTTPQSLFRCLAEWRPHVLHFIGHAEPRPTGGVLVLHGEEPRTHATLYEEDLARWVTGSPMRLVYLSSCGNPASGVAEILLRQGVTAVVTMRAALRDELAPVLARTFYQVLIAGGSVEEAAQATRRALPEETPGWGHAVLWLAGAEDLALPLAVPAAQPPAALPFRRAAGFVGRDELLPRLHDRLVRGSHSPVALIGMSGVGKSQTAIEYAHRFREHYPGGVFWVNAQETERLVEEIAAFGRYFQVPESLPPAERAAVVRDRLHALGQPALLIVDNVREETDLTWLPALGECRLLATSRSRHTLPPAFERIEAGRLDSRSSEILLQSCRQAETPAERQAVAEIAEILGNLPLALALAAQHMERLGATFSTYRDRLSVNRVQVLEQARRRFVTDTRHDGSIFDAIDMAYRSLSPAAQSLAGCAACFFSRGIALPLLRAAAGKDDEEFDEALGELWQSALVSRDDSERISLHELVRAYLLGQASTDTLSHYTQRAAEVLTDAFRTANDGLEWSGVRRETAHGREVAVLLRAQADAERLAPLLEQVGRYYYHQRELSAAWESLIECLSLTESTRGTHDLRTAEVLLHLAHAAVAQLRPSHAVGLVERAWHIAEACLPAQRPDLADYANSYGYVLRMCDRLTEARSFYERALAIRLEAHGRLHESVATCFNNLGTLAEAEGDLARAYERIAEALDIDRSLFGDGHTRVAIRRNNLGRILSAGKNWQEAAEQHRTALGINEEVYGPRHFHTAMSHVYLAGALRELERKPESFRHYAEALPTLEAHLGSQHQLCDKVREGLCHQGAND